MDWSVYYPAFVGPSQPNIEEESSTPSAAQVKTLCKDVTVADIGCGFGGLLVALGPKLPDELLLG
jgi:tRNA (guanine-N7-)-methyltransferase